MKKILVTGAGGYIGILTCQKLLEKGYKVIALDRYFFGQEKINLIKNQNLEILKTDTRYFDTKILKNVFAVIDCAGLSNDATSEIDPQLTIDINFKACIRIAQAAKKYGVKKYIYSGSASVYGDGRKKSLKETDELNPITQYAKSKSDCEKELLKLNDGNFSVTIFRNSTVFGYSPRMRFDLAINIMTMRAWKDGVIYVMGDGNQWRPFVHVNDVVEAFMLGLESEERLVSGEIYNVGFNNQNFQIKKLAEFIKEILPSTKIIFVPDNPDKRNYNVNFDKIKNNLSFKSTINLKDGILEIKDKLDNAIISPEDPTCYTLQWYQTLIDWDKKINDLKFKNKIF